MDEIRGYCDKYKHILLVKVENARNEFLSELRKRLRPGKLVFGKNTLVALALGKNDKTARKTNMDKIAVRLKGQCGLLFTDAPAEEAQSVLSSYMPMDYARMGALATETVQIYRGVETFAHLAHSMEAHLRKLGLPTILRDGEIHLLGDHTVCTAGKALTSDEAQVLRVLKIKQVQFRLDVVACWSRTEDGGTFEDFEDVCM